MAEFAHKRNGTGPELSDGVDFEHLSPSGSGHRTVQDTRHAIGQEQGLRASAAVSRGVSNALDAFGIDPNKQTLSDKAARLISGVIPGVGHATEIADARAIVNSGDPSRKNEARIMAGMAVIDGAAAATGVGAPAVAVLKAASNLPGAENLNPTRLLAERALKNAAFRSEVDQLIGLAPIQD